MSLRVRPSYLGALLGCLLFLFAAWQGSSAPEGTRLRVSTSQSASIHKPKPRVADAAPMTCLDCDDEELHDLLTEPPQAARTRQKQVLLAEVFRSPQNPSGLQPDPNRILRPPRAQTI